MKSVLAPAVFIFLLSSMLALKAQGQTELIEIDSFTRSAVRTVPYDKPFLIKAQIDAEQVKGVYLIPRYRNKGLDSTLKHYTRNGRTYNVPQLEDNYFWTRKVGDKNYLFISIADQYLFKPSEAYFIIPDLRQTDPSVVAFFDDFYLSTLPGNPNAAAALSSARDHLRKFETQMRKIFGHHLDFGFMTLSNFNRNIALFTTDFNSKLLTTYQQYERTKQQFLNLVPARATSLSTQMPSFDPLIFKQLLLDTLLNKEAVSYLSGRDYLKNDLVNDLMVLQQTAQLGPLLSGELSLHCIYCPRPNVRSNTVKDLSVRMTNLDSSVKQMAQLQRSLHLLKPTANAANQITQSVNWVNNWISQLQSSRDTISIMVRQRKKIEDIIMDSVFANAGFTYSQVLGGNTYLNFETRNKVLLTPDFGVVTPVFSKGKDLEYRIIPYLGFHVNLMAVDKDIAFSSYKKHPLQRLSLMVGWSLVNMNQDSAYANFFEKSSLLTGAGIRLSNVIRVTAGAQWLFKLGMDQNKKPTRDLQALPYVGLSFDLNIKQYLNGFVDLLSGVGKTNPVLSTPANDSP